MNGVLRAGRATVGMIVVIASVAVLFTLRGMAAAHPAAQESCSPPARIYYVDFWDTTDFCKHTVPLEEIFSGGPPPDGIPPIDFPTFDSLEEAATWLRDQSPVIAFELDGVARAYPLAIMTRHEIVNDVVGDVPVAVTFCPLCNSAIVFDRRVDGQVYRFGVSGNLRNSDLVMWDDVTKSWWQQFTGEGIVGQHAGDQLDIFPSLVVGFSEFQKQYPDGEVLSPQGRYYATNPYEDYDLSARPFLFDGQLDDRLFATERVLGTVLDGEAVAYPFEVLETMPVINDMIGRFEVVAFWQPGAKSALNAVVIDESQDVGMAALYDRELDGQVLTFSTNDDGQIIDDQTGSVWNVFGTALEGELAGAQLRQRLAFPHFWFAWAAFRPDTIIYAES